MRLDIPIMARKKEPLGQLNQRNPARVEQYTLAHAQKEFAHRIEILQTEP